MFERRKLDRMRMDALDAIAERSDGETSGRFPDFFGLYENQVAGSLVTVGAFLLDGVLHSPPVPEPDQKTEAKLIIQNLSTDGMVQASIFLAHAVIRLCLLDYEYEAKMGKEQAASEFLVSREEQMLGLVDRFFPVSEQDAAALEGAAASYRDFDLTAETIKERQPVVRSGWMNYLRDPEFFGEAAEGQTAEERRSDLLDSHFMVAGNYYRAVASRHAVMLATGPGYGQTKESGYRIEEDWGYESLLGELNLGGMWKGMGVEAYYDMLTTFAKAGGAEESG